MPDPTVGQSAHPQCPWPETRCAFPECNCPGGNKAASQSPYEGGVYDKAALASLSEKARARVNAGLYPHQNFWRVGRKVGRTIYAQIGHEPSDDDPLIGLMDTPSLAADAVEAHNARLTPWAEKS